MKKKVIIEICNVIFEIFVIVHSFIELIEQYNISKMEIEINTFVGVKSIFGLQLVGFLDCHPYHDTISSLNQVRQVHQSLIPK